MGISDLIIGLTIVAVGTSLPEMASSIAAARKGEHDIALGNILGSNLFNPWLWSFNRLFQQLEQYDKYRDDILTAEKNKVFGVEEAKSYFGFHSELN